MKTSATLLLLAMSPIAFAAQAGHDRPEPACAPVTIFGEGVISRPGDHWESRLALSPDRRVALWTVGNPGTVILMAERRGDGWGEPKVVPFSGVYEDNDPAFSPDGRTLYFTSKRPLVAGGPPRATFDLWMVRYGGWRGWGAPEHLGAGPNSDADELYPSIDRLGNLYFGSNRDGAQWDVWRSARRRDGRFGAAVKVEDGVSTGDYWEYNPEISPDGRTLLFASLNRPGGYGWGDVYLSRMRRGAFAPAQNLGACVNSNADDYHPTMLWQENRLVWVRNVIEDPDWYPDFYTARVRLPD
jgi:Tol biopolymer transport system component